MRKVISFDKKLEFKTMIGEVTSISLDPNLSFSDDSDISGDLVISGKYKLTAASRLEDDFVFSLPVEIALSEKLEEETRNVYIDDFRYEVEEDDTLNCQIDLVVEGVEKIEVDEDSSFSEENLEKIEEIQISSDSSDMREQSISEEQITNEIVLDNTDIEEVAEVEPEKEGHNVGSLFSSFKDSDESFATYSVYIVRENDTIDTIMNKYQVHREELEDYNDLDNLIIGTKIIIPTQHE